MSINYSKTKKSIFKSFHFFLGIWIVVSSFPTFVFAQETISPTPTPAPTEVPEISQPVLEPTPGIDAKIVDPVVSTDFPVNDSLGISGGSAQLKQQITVGTSKANYKADDTVIVTLTNTTSVGSVITLFDADGTKLDVETKVVKDIDPTVIEIYPPEQFKPGRFRLKIEDPNKNVTTSEFYWGVLAINTSKPSYTVGEKAFMAIAVLDDVGEMVCNADVVLEITSPSGVKKVFTTNEGSIIVNPQCYSKEFTIIPDYQATYEDISEVGNYAIKLTATTEDGTYEITDGFEVSDNLPFEIKRITATRIYPPHTYPVEIKIKANQDFTGSLTEKVPASFVISQNVNTTGYNSVNLNSGTLGASYDKSIYEMGKPYFGDYRINLGFGKQHKDPKVGQKYTDFGVLGHDGVDFALPMNTPVLSVDDGEIVKAGDGDYGITVVIEHSWGKSYYGHLDKVLASIGDKVTKGQTIAMSGNTGLSSGPHLHFGVKLNENDFENGYYGKINPISFLGMRETGAEHGKVSGVPNREDLLTPGNQEITWNLDIKAGQEITIGYNFKAPLVSPELYLLGPLKFTNSSTQLVYEEARRWQIAADAIVVNGGIVTSEAQFGGLQRKVAYVNNNWYAFYNDGTDIFWKKSPDGLNWGDANNLDAAEDNDADNYNPSIDFSSTYIHIAYLDESADQVQMLTLETATDLTSQTTNPCALASPGAFTVSTYIVSVASYSTGGAVVAYSDTSAGSNFDAFEVTGLTSASCSSLDIHPGEIAFGTWGPGITAGDRPVLVGEVSSGGIMAVYQDGSNLRSAFYSPTDNEWRRNGDIIAAIPDTTYSVVTDGGNDVWVLTQNGTTATRLYHYPVTGTGMSTSGTIDNDIGNAGDDQDSYMDIYCPTATNCKIVYISNMETTSPDLMFRDCDNATCTTGTTINIDSDVGNADVGGNPRIFCPASDNCKIVYGDMGIAAPDAVFIDCPAGHEDCDNAGTSGTCASGGRTCTIVDSDLGAADTEFYGDVYCPSDVSSDTDCKFAFFNSADETNDAIWFADCSNASCSTRDALTSIHADMNADATYANAMLSLWCPTSANCKVLFHDAVNGDLTLRDCSNSACSSADATTDIDTDVGDSTVSVPNDIDCSAGSTDCKMVYADGSQLEVNFVDCANEACSSPTITKIDDTAGGFASGTGVDTDISIYCVSGTDCKGSFVSSVYTYFFDCDDATCTSGSVERLDSIYQNMSTVDCGGGSADCKIAAIAIPLLDTTAFTLFDCTNESCTPDWESLTAPWTSETNVTSVSLTYDSTNTDLIANIIKDATEQAYYNISDASTISWAGSTAYEFTAGDLDNMSSPESAAGTNRMGVLLRQGSNMEFDLLTAGAPMNLMMRHGKFFSGGEEQPFSF